MTLPGRISTNAMLTARDRYFASFVLSPWADDLARRLARLSIGPLLEVIGDTGVLTQAIASAQSAGMTIVATDPDPDIVAHATGKPGMARVIWQRADPHALPFNDATFGIVTCQFGISTLNDKVRVFKQARRVMKQGGRFVFSVFAALDQNPVAACVQQALDRFFGDNPPRFIAEGLHGYADNNATDDDLTEAGFTDAIYSTVELPFASISARDVATGYCLGTPLEAQLMARAGQDVEPVLDAVTQALECRFGGGPVLSRMRAYVISAAG